MFNNSVNSCFINVVKSSEVLKENKKSENRNLCVYFGPILKYRTLLETSGPRITPLIAFTV